jgi:hypothetical protein
MTQMAAPPIHSHRIWARVSSPQTRRLIRDGDLNIGRWRRAERDDHSEFPGTQRAAPPPPPLEDHGAPVADAGELHCWTSRGWRMRFVSGRSFEWCILRDCECLSMKLMLACFAIAVGMLPTAQSSAQNASSSGLQTVPANNGEAAIASGKLAFWCTPGGHRWDVLATNASGRSYQCTVICSFRTSNGRVRDTSCTTTVPDGLNRVSVCSAINNTISWAGLATFGTHSCR